MDAVKDALIDGGLLAIVRYLAGGDVSAVVERILAGGIHAVEVTTNTPGWEDVIRGVAGSHPDAVIGAGTVTSVSLLERADAAGAKFVVSPGFDPIVTADAFARGLEVVPGVATGTEIQAALAAGVRLIKLFPAGALGLNYLRQLRGPFPDADFVATGGIGVDDIAAWRGAGARVVSLGGDLTGRRVPETNAEWHALDVRIARAVRSADR